MYKITDEVDAAIAEREMWRNLACKLAENYPLSQPCPACGKQFYEQEGPLIEGEFSGMPCPLRKYHKILTG